MIFTNIKKYYNDRLVLNIKSIEFKNGKIYGLKGHNGSGKTTLCRILANIDSENINKANNISIGYMPQHSVVFDMKVIDNMMLNTDDRKKAMNLLKEYNIDSLCNKNAKTLSGGEKQKLCLARLMIKKYDMLILDEPTSSMDKDSTEIAEKVIKEYNEKYKSIIIIVSHEEGQLEKLTKNIYTLEKGELV